MTIYAFVGKKGSGKDTACDIIGEQMGIPKIAIADSLKALCTKVFALDPNLFYDPELKDKPLGKPLVLTRELIDSLGQELGIDLAEDLLGLSLETPRRILQIVGTEIIRKYIGPDWHLQRLGSKIAEIGGNCCISDVRFKDELQYIRSISGSKVVFIKRNLSEMNRIDTHQSEIELESLEQMVDVVVENNGDIKSLGEKIALLLGTDD